MLMLAQASTTKTSMTMYKVETFRHQTPEGNHEKCFYAVKKNIANENVSQTSFQRFGLFPKGVN